MSFSVTHRLQADVAFRLPEAKSSFETPADSWSFTD
jgi:hypothetical protein